MNVKSQSELDIGGRETCHLSRDSSATKIPQKYFLKLQFAFKIEIYKTLLIPLPLIGMAWGDIKVRDDNVTPSNLYGYHSVLYLLILIWSPKGV